MPRIIIRDRTKISKEIIVKIYLSKRVWEFHHIERYKNIYFSLRRSANARCIKISLKIRKFLELDRLYAW